MLNQFSAHPDIKIFKITTTYNGYATVKIIEYSHKKFDGNESNKITRELICRNGAAGVILYDPTLSNVLLIEQCRAGPILNQDPNPWLLEVVAGVIDSKHSSPTDTAYQESIEEANCQILKLMPIYQYYSSPGVSNEYFHLYCGIIDSSSAGGIFGLDDESEDIKVHLFTIKELANLLNTGKIHNSHTIIAIQWLLANHQNIS